MSTAVARFTVLTPVYETPPQLLDECIASVEAQTFEDWELVLVDDGSPSDRVRQQLAVASARDPRIRVLLREANGGIVAASNDGLAVATGEMVALLDHDDTLHPEALAALDAVIADDVDYAYTDQDLIDEAGRHSEPFYKPDWSPERFRCQMYTNHLGALRRTLVDEVGGFRDGFEGSQDFDLVFRVTERARRVVHVPRVLYHWRITEASVNASPEAKPYAWLAGGRAIAAHLERTGFEATVDDQMVIPGLYTLTPALRSTPPVSIVVPTGGGRRDIAGEDVLLAERCLRSITTTSTYPDYEVVLVVDTHVDPDDVAAMVAAGGDRVRVVAYDRPFNFSEKCNLGVVRSDGEHVLLLNDDTEVITPDWLEHLVMYSRQDDVGAVGARLQFGDGRLQHVGLGALPGVAFGHFYRGFAADHPTYYGVADLPGDFLAVTGACLMSRREVFDEVGGLCTDLPGAYNDVDYCLKVWAGGRRVAYSPGARLFHHESSSREAEVRAWERDLLVRRWARFAGPDPFYNVNFRQDSLDYVRPPYLPDGSTLRV